MEINQVLIHRKRGYVDYNLNKFCVVCREEKPKTLIFCDDCGKKLRVKSPRNKEGIKYIE